MRSAILATILGATALVHAQTQPNWGFKAVTTEEKRAFFIQNKMRTHPKVMVKVFKKALTYFDGKLFKVPGRIPLRTNEGARAVKEAIAFLEKMKPRKPLKWSPALYLASRAHCLDQQKNGGMGHTGSNGSSPGQRIRRFGSTNATGENISYGSSTGSSIISQLFVDDGVPSRGHRDNIVSEKFQATGISICKLPTRFRTGAVLTYSGVIKNRDVTKALMKSQKLPKAASISKKKPTGKGGKSKPGKKKTGWKPKRKLRRGCRRRLRGCAAARRRRAAARRRQAAMRKNQSPAMQAYNKERRAQYIARIRHAFHLKRKCIKDKACMKATNGRGRGCPRYAVNYYRSICNKNAKCKANAKAKKVANAKKLRALYMKISKKELAKDSERRRKACRARRAARARRQRRRALWRQRRRNARKNKRRGCRFRRAVQRRNRRRSCRCRRIAALRRIYARRRAAAAKRKALAAKREKTISNQAKTIARLQKQLAAVKSGKPSIIVPRKAYNQVQADIALLKKKVDSVDVPQAALPKSEKKAAPKPKKVAPKKK